MRRGENLNNFLVRKKKNEEIRTHLHLVPDDCFLHFLWTKQTVLPAIFIKSNIIDTVTPYGPNAMVRNVKNGSNGTVLFAASVTGVFRYDGKLFTNIASKIGSRRLMVLRVSYFRRADMISCAQNEKNEKKYNDIDDGDNRTFLLWQSSKSTPDSVYIGTLDSIKMSKVKSH